MSKKEEISFEQGLKRLEEIVDRLSSAEVSLKESFKLYEEGTELVQYCSKLLGEFEGKVKKLSGDGETGFVTEPFEENDKE
ncbi:MAG: exodeoxyribonuclease VII small subunit [candidate division Zixibacteria bacterium]|nr:exodeoxyribonuclease VII small subunit [candidate division Zixibacteria bacterium]